MVICLRFSKAKRLSGETMERDYIHSSEEGLRNSTKMRSDLNIPFWLVALRYETELDSNALFRRCEIKMEKNAHVIGLIVLFATSVIAEDSFRAGLVPVSTYSIVGRDPDTGQLGVAVQSHYFAVGSEVAFAEAGVAAIATQAWVEPSYGVEGLRLMRDGMSATESLSKLLSEDEGADFRQVGFVDNNGDSANHSGAQAVGEQCTTSGPNYAAQANIMWKPGVCDAMASAFQNTDGDLATKLISALHAAEAAGGDIRGRQSAAIKIVGGNRDAITLEQTIYDVRVDDHSNPVTELDRLLTIARAFRYLKLGDDRWSKGNLDDAVDLYFKAREIMPDSYEMNFWLGVLYVESGRTDESLEYFALAFEDRPILKELIPRLAASGSLPKDEAILDRILAVGRNISEH